MIIVTSICRDFDINDNSSTKDRRKFLMVPKCIYFQSKEGIRYWTFSSEFPVEKYRKSKKNIELLYEAIKQI